MVAQKIGSLLASDELRALSRSARRLTELQQVYAASAPPPLAQASRIGNCRAGTLFVLADNPAVAAKLRQLAPRLLVKIRKREPEITGIRIDVQVRHGPAQPFAGPQKSILNAEIIENFRKLSERVTTSPLKSALTALVRHHGGDHPPSQITSTKRSRT